MISAKLTTLDRLKIKVFWINGYSVIICAHDVTNKVLSSDPDYVVYVVMWPKFSISVREVIIS